MIWIRIVFGLIFLGIILKVFLKNISWSDLGTTKIWSTLGSASTARTPASQADVLKRQESIVTIIVSALILILLHWAIWWGFQDFWVSWWNESGFLFYQFLILMGILIISMSKKKFLLVCGGIAVVTAGLIFTIGITRSAYLKTKDADQIIAAVEEIKKSPAERRVPSSGCILPYNAAMAKVVGEFWRKWLPAQQAEAMILIAERESGFNQFKKDKTPYRRCPTPGNPSTSDVGVMQINENAWLATAIKLGPEYNFYNTAEGNLKMALWIFRKEGFKPWSASISREITQERMTSLPTRSASPSMITVIAPVDIWSEPIEINGRRNYRAEPKGDVKVRINKDDNRVYDDGPGKTYQGVGPLSSIQWIEFKGTKEPTVVEITFK